MITVIKLIAAGALAFAIVNPGNRPLLADSKCECKADTAVQKFTPRAEDCECKAKAD